MSVYTEIIENRPEKDELLEVIRFGNEKIDFLQVKGVIDRAAFVVLDTVYTKAWCSIEQDWTYGQEEDILVIYGTRPCTDEEWLELLKKTKSQMETQKRNHENRTYYFESGWHDEMKSLNKRMRELVPPKPVESEGC
jgi:hypothetical protein